MLDDQFRGWIERAKAVPIGAVVDARRLPLRKEGRERVGPCPNCGSDGKGLSANRFSVNTVKRVFRCRKCKDDGGDVIELVMWLDGCDFVRACETLTGEPSPRGGGRGLSEAERAQLDRERAEAEEKARAAEADYREAERQRLIRWWKRGRPAAGSPVEAYLGLRRCTLPPRAHLKFSPNAKLWASGKRGAEVVHTGPAMLAAVLGPDGRFAGLHTTWIDLADRDGKARVPDPETGEFVPAKKVRGSAKRGRIELVPVAEPWHVIMGEGIETTLSMRDDLLDAGRDLTGVAFWCAYSLGNLGGPAKDKLPHPTMKDRGNRPVRIAGRTPDGEGIPIPDSVERITFLRDGDSDAFLTETTLERASLRYARPGRVILAADAPAGSDFNDLRRGFHDARA